MSVCIGLLFGCMNTSCYIGKGIDIVQRKIWAEYAKYGAQPSLLAEPILPHLAQVCESASLVGAYVYSCSVLFIGGFFSR